MIEGRAAPIFAYGSGAMALDYDAEYEEPAYRPRRRLGHSGLGIVSLVIAVVVGFAEIILLVIAGILESRTPGGVDENSPEAIILGLLLIGGMVMSLVGGVLAAVALVQGDRSKIFPILGLALNGMIILGMIGIIIIGLFAA
jgi:hypothetical protein